VGLSVYLSTMAFDFSAFKFYPVLPLPSQYEVYDFSKAYDPNRPRFSDYGIGRYNEKRPGMYTTDLFQSDPSAVRDVHIGIDIAAPVGTPVHASYDGRIFMTDVRTAPGDYGGTVLLEHDLGGTKLWALYGHLSHASATHRSVGSRVKAGDIVGWLGEKSENGGWNPHLHFQLSWVEPKVCDMPGTVNEKDLPAALQMYPDPRLILGPVY
jgi:murein DD-endopeptidase MepM/ murein hydrolase activator NlpD